MNQWRFWGGLAIATILVSCDPGNDHLRFGNPSNANTTDLNNYLLTKPEFVLSYNCTQGTANWVSWQLNQSWLGDSDRQDDFRPDETLPDGCYAVRPNDYRGSGYDRGHLTPSGDRTNSIASNSATFVMSNMIPQAPANNREVWRELEEYSRDLVADGKTLYIIAGGVGQKGAIAKNKVTVPESTWKILVVLDSDSAPITAQTRVIAVNMPNNDSVKRTDWQDYIVSVDEIESLTGYDFLSDVPTNIQETVEQKRDS
ncbi:MAG: DNA/RNA non-specific endonuclease [Jaaginema sp. PMC 1079.18]|nr:DNA/RNA non-specific endonuclease [Jaaginema sp. PMC 1080.18]MEC4853754.1 DNA/RNA non-specific endonuclease [Jaaginema sp. PMC 1079.18]